MNILINFLTKHYKTILSGLFGLFILYYLVFFLTPRIRMSSEQKEKIDSLNHMIEQIYRDQKKLDSNIYEFNSKIQIIDSNINKLKGEKTTIKEYYYEKITSVDGYSDPQLDSFFSKRYNY